MQSAFGQSPIKKARVETAVAARSNFPAADASAPSAAAPAAVVAAAGAAAAARPAATNFQFRYSDQEFQKTGDLPAHLFRLLFGSGNGSAVGWDWAPRLPTTLLTIGRLSSNGQPPE